MKTLLTTPWKQQVIPPLLRYVRDQNPTYSQLVDYLVNEVPHCNSVDVQLQITSLLANNILNVNNGVFSRNITPDNREIIEEAINH